MGNECLKELEPYASIIPLVDDYVECITHTYIGHTGSSYRYNRTDFYANGDFVYIEKMFENFDDTYCEAFIDALKRNKNMK